MGHIFNIVAIALILIGLWRQQIIARKTYRRFDMNKEEFVAAINASTAEIKQHVTDASARVTSTVNKLTAEIEDLKTKVGTVLTQEDLDAIINAQKEVIAEVDKVDPTTASPDPIA